MSELHSDCTHHYAYTLFFFLIEVFLKFSHSDYNSLWLLWHTDERMHFFVHFLTDERFLTDWWMNFVRGRSSKSTKRKICMNSKPIWIKLRLNLYFFFSDSLFRCVHSVQINNQRYCQWAFEMKWNIWKCIIDQDSGPFFSFFQKIQVEQAICTSKTCQINKISISLVIHCI